MLWVLQNNFYSEAGYVRLVEGIERLGLPHVIVKPVPFTHRLLAADADTSTSAVDVESIPEAVIDTTRAIFPMGSYTLARIGQQRGWSPGAQLANLDYPSWANAWGAERLLNPGARIAKFKDAEFSEDSMFIRPVEDSKSFAGKVYERGEWRGWRNRVLETARPSDPLHGDTEVLLAAPVTIHTETRCWVVDGVVVTASGYKRGARVVYDANVDDDVVEYARACVDAWVPNRAFVLDIAQTETGCRIVEVNCLNAAGFYAGDTMRLLTALEDVRW